MRKLLTIAFLLTSLGVATAGPTEFPLFFHGTTARVFTLTGQRCVGTVNEWTPQLMTVRMHMSSACGAVNFLLRITPADVRKVDHNPPGFWPAAWHVVNRPFVWAGEGIFIVLFGLHCLFGGNCSP